MMNETIFDEMNMTKTEAKIGLGNLLENILCSHKIEPQFEKAVNHMSAFLVRTVERRV